MAHDITTIPNIQVDIIDPRTGRMDRTWRMFFENLWKLQGSGTTDITVEDLQKSPQFEPPIPFPEDVLPPTPQLGTIASYNLDGSPTAGGVSYGTGPAIAVTPAGTLGQVLTSAAAATPTWTTPAALTKTDDTNVTMTLGGTPATALLQTASMALGWTGTLAVSRGGTGGSSSIYLDTAFTSQTTVTVTHNFGKYPVVNVINNTGAVIVPLTITHGSLNAFTVTFSAATTGNIIAVIGY